MAISVGDPMNVSDVKNILNITSTVYDTFISNNLWSMAQYVNDYCNNGLAKDYEPTDTHYTTLTASSLAGTTATIVHPWMIPGSVIVYSSDQSEIYDEDHDYEIDYKTGGLVYLAESTNGTSTGGYAIVHYSYIDPQGGARTVIAQLLRMEWETKPNVLSESVGPLSRTYDGAGLPRGMAKMLRPYRRPSFV